MNVTLRKLITIIKPQLSHAYVNNNSLTLAIHELISTIHYYY